MVAPSSDILPSFQKFFAIHEFLIFISPKNAKILGLDMPIDLDFEVKRKKVGTHMTLKPSTSVCRL